jgi:hypothetical protein
MPCGREGAFQRYGPSVNMIRGGKRVEEDGGGTYLENLCTGCPLVLTLLSQLTTQIPQILHPSKQFLGVGFDLEIRLHLLSD